MLKYIILLLFGIILSGLLGFGVMAGTGATIAKVFFACFLILFVGSLLYDPSRRHSEY